MQLKRRVALDGVQLDAAHSKADVRVSALASVHSEDSRASASARHRRLDASRELDAAHNRADVRALEHSAVSKVLE